MGVVARLIGFAAAAARPLIGRATTLPPDLVTLYPELANVHWRRGGLPVRVGGWCLGQASVSAITLWRTIWLAPGVPLSVELLLHEARHVQQFEASRTFPILYLWESLRRGYVRNRFEVDARAYAAARLREPDMSKPRG